MGVDVKLTLHTRETIAKIEGTASRRMQEAVNEVRNTVLETLSGSRKGRTYYVPGTRKKYTASAPGQAPAQATSALRQSIKALVKGVGDKVIGMVGTSLDYGRMLEYGTSKMAPRPWLRISLEKTAGKIKSIFSKRFM